MKIKSKTLISLLAGAGVLSSQAIAAITVSQTSAFPETTAVETFETPLSGGALEIRDGRLGTQTFQVSTTFQIDKIYIGINTPSGFNPAQTFSVSIFAVADTNAGNPNDVPTGTNLLTTTGETISLGTGGSGNVLEIDLTGADEIVLAATTGTAGYALQIVNSESTSAFQWVLNKASDGTNGVTVETDQYTPGQAYAGALGGGQTHGNSDFTLAFTAVPEPSTGLMALLASTALLLRRRRA